MPAGFMVTQAYSSFLNSEDGWGGGPLPNWKASWPKKDDQNSQ